MPSYQMIFYSIAIHRSLHRPSISFLLNTIVLPITTTNTATFPEEHHQSSCQSDDYYHNISIYQMIKKQYINHLPQRASSCQLLCNASSLPLPSPSHSLGSSSLLLFLARETTFRGTWEQNKNLQMFLGNILSCIENIYSILLH